VSLGSLSRAGLRFAIYADFNMVVVPMDPLEEKMHAAD
jgi:hypothetical protein